jgi:serine phosphatase RsbU (regulator of sigma subunit)
MNTPPMPSMPRRLLAFVLLTLFSSVAAHAQEVGGGDVFNLTPETLQAAGGVSLNARGWRYHAGDDAAWAAANHDDAAWERLPHTTLRSNSQPRSGWTGAAWFRLRLRVDERLVNQPLALRFYHWGASEIYLDGNLIERFGMIHADGDEEFNPQWRPIPLVFTRGGEHTIAVRYSYSAASDLTRGRGAWLVRAESPPGFYSNIDRATPAIIVYGAEGRDFSRHALFIGILFALALLHFLLFVFYRRERTNLFYSLFAFSLAAGAFIAEVLDEESSNATIAAVLFILNVTTYALALSALLAFSYVAFAAKFSKHFYVLLALWSATILFTAVLVRSDASLYVVSAVILLTLADVSRILVRALRERRDGARIIAAGVLLFACGLVALLVREVSETLGFTGSFPAIVSSASGTLILLAMPLSVSVFLARQFARTNRNLEIQLGQVQELSARQIEHERTEAALRMEHEKERAENERRAKELEEARGLQLSMLPREVPQLAALDIAAYMKPATEVGGDYYDFHVDANGVLTVVVGDATGHGMKAGTIVTATKSLFNFFAGEPDIRRFFRESSRALKALNLRGMFMAMVMIKIEGDRLRASAAGMPALLIYRAATCEVEEIAIKGMPLGSIVGFPYQEQEVSLACGDVVVMMSDGFPERFNASGRDARLRSRAVSAARCCSPIAAGNHQPFRSGWRRVGGRASAR